MSSPATGFAFFCDDFRPASRDPLSCELCGHLESEHPVLADDVAPAELAPAVVPAEAMSDSEWLREGIAKCDRWLEQLRAQRERFDVIEERIGALKRRAGLA